MSSQELHFPTDSYFASPSQTCQRLLLFSYDPLSELQMIKWQKIYKKI